MSYGQAQSRGRLSIDLASIAKGPFGINERMLMGHDFDEGVREHPKYDLDSYRTVGKRVLEQIGMSSMKQLLLLD